MTRHYLLYPTGTTMRIGGEVVSKVVARYDYRCAECLGELQYWNAGLKCKANHDHRFFVHKRDVPAVQAMRDAEVSDISTSYEIIDGVLKPKGDLLCQLRD